MKVCDIVGCGREAKYFRLNGLSRLCEFHKNYWNYLKPRLFNLKVNCGKRGKDEFFKKFL